jgi:hypothetical protein
LAPNEAVSFEGDDHLVHRGRGNLKVTLHVGLGRRATEHVGVGVDEGQVSAPDTTYKACPVKRARATKEEVLGRRQRLRNIVAEMCPMTVRQVFYQATVAGIVEKSEAGYAALRR